MMSGDQRPESLRHQRHRGVAVGRQMRKNVRQDLWQDTLAKCSLIGMLYNQGKAHHWESYRDGFHPSGVLSAL